jgi:hypothetical protein
MLINYFQPPEVLPLSYHNVSKMVAPCVQLPIELSPYYTALYQWTPEIKRMGLKAEAQLSLNVFDMDNQLAVIHLSKSLMEGARSLNEEETVILERAFLRTNKKTSRRANRF